MNILNLIINGVAFIFIVFQIFMYLNGFILIVDYEVDGEYDWLPVEILDWEDWRKKRIKKSPIIRVLKKISERLEI